MLTFEKIRDFERAEKDSKKLQKLPDDFLDQVREYLQKKEKTPEKNTSDILEIENVKHTIKRLLEMRERKIMDSVLMSVRSNISPENLTKDEERMFSLFVDQMKAFRDNFFGELKKEQAIADSAMYRVKKAIPQFVGPDMNTYMLEENQVLAIPKPLSDLLLKEGVIEPVRSEASLQENT